MPGIAAEGGGQMRPIGLIQQIEAAEVPNLGTMVPIPSVEGYLHELAALCLEVSRKPTLLPVLIAILRLVPSTITALQRARRLAA